MSSVKIVWTTPEIDKVLGYITRVSNPANQANEKVDGLLRYCMTHGHVSPLKWQTEIDSRLFNAMMNWSVKSVLPN